MSEAVRVRKSSQQRQRQHRHVLYTNDAEEPLFQARLAEWRGSTAAQEYGDSESAAMRYVFLKTPARTKYTCPSCSLILWGNPGVKVICGACEKVLDADTLVEDGTGKLRQAPRRKYELPAERLLVKIYSQLLRIGNNLNQIARALNSGGFSSPEAIKDAGDDVRDAVQIIRRVLGLFS